MRRGTEATIGKLSDKKGVVWEMDPCDPPDARLNRDMASLGSGDLTMTWRYAHLSQKHLRDSVNLLNDTPCGKQMVNISQKAKRLTTAKLPTSCNSSHFMVGTRGFEPPTP